MKAVDAKRILAQAKENAVTAQRKEIDIRIRKAANNGLSLIPAHTPNEEIVKSLKDDGFTVEEYPQSRFPYFTISW